jgi:acyl-CoA synthetase (AMP-forming)/AMP-acid ligase II
MNPTPPAVSPALSDTLLDVFARHARERGDRPALIQGQQVISHADFQAAVARQAAALASAGLRQGDRFVLLAGNRAEVLVLLGAAAWLGAVMVPLNLRLSAAELAQQVQDACPRLLVLEPEFVAALDAATALHGDRGDAPRLSLGAAPDGSMALVGDAPVTTTAPAVAGHSDDAVLMLYTAAVDGRARGAVTSQRNLVASAAQLGLAWGLGPDDRWLGVLPLFHAAGIGLSLATLAAGGACVLLPRWDPAFAVEAVDAHRITLAATFAPMLGGLLDAAEAAGSTLSSLRVLTGLESPEAQSRLAARCPAASFWAAYGQAEVSTMACLGRASDRPGAAGRAAALTEVAVLGDAGRPVPTGEVGEIVVRGPTVFLGYWDPETRRPRATTSAADPWHRTGDLGRLDAEGWLFFSGRAAYKQLIKTGGENVYPVEVEMALLEHPAVAEAFVFGRPDAQWGEAVHARCALHPGATIDEGTLIEFVGSRLARYKRPRRIAFGPAPLDRSKL